MSTWMPESFEDEHTAGLHRDRFQELCRYCTDAKHDADRNAELANEKAAHLATRQELSVALAELSEERENALIVEDVLKASEVARYAAEARENVLREAVTQGRNALHWRCEHPDAAPDSRCDHLCRVLSAALAEKPEAK